MRMMRCLWDNGVMVTLILLFVLDCFYSASGLRINMSKSKIMGVNVKDEKVKHAASKLGCLTLKSPFLYLGTKVGATMSRVSDWKEVVEKVKSRLSKWKMKALSIGGRLTLLKSVLGSIPIFHMSIFRVPSSVLNMLESIRSHFFNGHELGSNKATWVKWSRVLTAIDHGGLGVSSLYALNRVEVWNLESSGDFSVSSIRKVIDEKRFPSVCSKTRWVKYVAIKVNVLAWKIKIDALPTRFNISRRGIDIHSILCPVCDGGVESSKHLFFRCYLSKQIARKVSLWWNVAYVDVNSYAEWYSWIVSLRIAAKSKLMLEGVFYTMWWQLWTYRNKLLFDDKVPSKTVIFDSVVSSSFYGCSANDVTIRGSLIFCSSSSIPLVGSVEEAARLMKYWLKGEKAETTSEVEVPWVVPIISGPSGEPNEEWLLLRIQYTDLTETSTTFLQNQHWIDL
ncbi:RNA-directed DNA polymerase, eukaryota [Tanacetum coccineum]